ncbi:MAG TPA: YjbQ family protein [Patescibacteria group bacterium]|jgi:secondary thiamine-phosphate synthase enzyme|nr:YjbQ family protein [Patescibacteria group bacterium]
MKQAQDVLNIRTRGQGHHDITSEVSAWVARQGMQTGLLVVYIQHVLASLSIRQHSDHDDLHTFFRRLEGDEDMAPRPSHLYATQICIPLRDGALTFGAQQGLFLLEQRDSANTRHLVLHLIGE